MPVFINEVVFKSDLQKTTVAPETAAAADATNTPADRAGLIAEVTQAVMDKLEREFERMGER